MQVACRCSNKAFSALGLDSAFLLGVYAGMRQYEEEGQPEWSPYQNKISDTSTYNVCTTLVTL